MNPTTQVYPPGSQGFEGFGAPMRQSVPQRRMTVPQRQMTVPRRQMTVPRHQPTIGRGSSVFRFR